MYVACFRVGTLRRDTSQQETTFSNVTLRSPTLTSGPKLVNVRKRSGHTERGDRRREQNRTGQSCTLLSTRAFLCTSIASHRKCPSLLSWKCLFFYGKRNIKKKRLENRAVVDGRACFLLLFLPKSFHYSLRRRTMWHYPHCQMRISFPLSEEKWVSGSKNSFACRIVFPWKQSGDSDPAPLVRWH